MDYTMAQAKRDFERGFISGASLVAPKGLEAGWWVLFESRLGAEGGPLVDARSRDVRVFKTVDAAVNALHQVGFSPDTCFMAAVRK